MSKKPLSRPEELELIRLAQAGNSAAMGRLVEAHKPFVQCLMRHTTYPEWMDMEDVLQEGCIGLMDGVLTFDVESGNRLLTHAYWKIKKALTNHMNKMGYMMSIPYLKLVELKKHLNKLDRTPYDVTEAELKKFSTFKNFQLLALSVGMCSFEAPSFRQFTNQHVIDDSEDDSVTGSFVTNDHSLISRSPEEHFVSGSLHDDIHDVIASLPAIQGILLSMYLGVYAFDEKHSLKDLVGQRAEVEENGEFNPGKNGCGVMFGKSYNTISKLVRGALKTVRSEIAISMGDVLDDMGIKANDSGS
jgi:RNA polymerase sigma factor (sigma-70 family)